jgi:ubiquinone/menaquinone biosynthesis C-methylase UbiE
MAVAAHPTKGQIMSTSGTPNTQRFKETVRQEWTDGAAPWRKWYPQFAVMSRAATGAIVQAAQVKPGMQVLDVASGSGEPALTLAAALAPDGHVTATDLVPEMLTIAEENARQQDLANITFRQADAEALPFRDHMFDLVTCRFGVMFWPNAPQALREIYRVLKLGGRAAFTAWGPVEQNPYFASTIGVVMQYVHRPPPESGAPNPFNFAKAGTLSTTLEDAGFSQVQEESHSIPWPFPGSPEQCWDCVREFGGVFRRNFEELAPEQREQVKGAVLAAFRQYYDGQQVNFPAVIVVASAVRSDGQAAAAGRIFPKW